MKYLIIFLFLSFFISCGKDEPEDKNASLAISAKESLDFSLTFNNGKSLAIKAKEGLLSFENEQKATMFFFMSSWCKPCLAEIAHLNALQEKYKDGFNVIALMMDDDNNLDLNNFIEKNGIKFLVSFSDMNFLLSKSVGGLSGIPTMVLYKSDGSFYKKYLGIIPQEMLDIDVQKAIM